MERSFPIFQKALAVCFCLIAFGSFAQEYSAGINTEAPNPNAVLHLVSPNGNQGLMLPKLTRAQRGAMTLSEEDNGLLVYDSEDNIMYYWLGARWRRFSTRDELVLGLVNNQLSIQNGNEVDLTQYLDNTDDQTAAEVSFNNDTTNIVSTTVQGAIGEIYNILVNAALTDDQSAAEVPYDNTTSGLTATDIQGAVDEIANNVGGAGLTDDQTAAEVPVAPAGNLTATDVQSALTELQTDIDAMGGGGGPETDPTVPSNLKDGVDWSEISGIPADIADGDDDSGATPEADPTVPANIKDGIDWSEISGIPADIADGDDGSAQAINDFSYDSPSKKLTIDLQDDGIHEADLSELTTLDEFTYDDTGQKLRLRFKDGSLEEADLSDLATESDPTVPANIKDGIDWSEISGIPADIADGDDDSGATPEADPTVPANIKDGIDWSEISGIPADIADGDGGGAWGTITGIPADIADGDQDTQLDEATVDSYVSNNGFVTTEADPTVPANIKDGIDWTEISGIPADIADGDGGGTWGSITGIPADIADGDQDTQLDEATVDSYVSNNGFVTTEADPTVPANIKDGIDWTEISGIPADIADGDGGGTWGSITGIPADIADGDQDTQLDEATVDSYVSNNGFVTTEADPTVPANIKDGIDWTEISGIPADIADGDGGGTWGSIAGIPADIADGDQDTQLDEATVDSYVSNNGFVTTEADPTVPANIKDGIDWTEISGIPADIADGDGGGTWGSITGIPADIADGDQVGLTTVNINTTLTGDGNATALGVNAGTGPDQIVQLDGSGALPPVDGSNLTGITSAGFTGALTGDVTGSQGATSVATVGGQTAADIAAATALVNGATSLDTDATDDLALTTNPATGDITGNYSTGLNIGAGVIENNDIAAGAAIDGSKINPNFGAQDIVARSIDIGPGLADFDASGNAGVSNNLNVGNNVSVSGTVTASAFSGNGSGLTGVTATVAANSITETELAPDAVTTAEITDGTITDADIADVAVTKITGAPNLDLDATDDITTADVGTAANQIVQLNALGALPAVDGSNLTGITSTGFTGTLTGDVTGTQGATAVSSVGGETAAAVAAATALVNGAVALDTDATDDFDGDFANLSNVPAGLTDGDDVGITSVMINTTLTGDGNGVALGVNAGTGPDQIVQLDGTGALPAVDGSNLSGVTATGFTGTLTGDVTGTQGATAVSSVGGETAAAIAAATALVNGAVALDTDATDDFDGDFANLSNVPAGLTDGDDVGITSVMINTTLTGDGNGVALGVNAGTGPDQIVQLDGTGALPAVDGSNLSGVTATGFTGTLTGDVTGTQGATAVSSVGGETAAAVAAATALVNGAVALDTDATDDFDGDFANLSNVPAGLTDGDDVGITSVMINTTLTGDGNGVALGVNAGTGPDQIVQLDGTGALPAVDGSNLSGVTATGFTGTLTGDVTGTQGATAVSSVGGQTAPAIAAATALVNGAVALDTDATDDFDGDFGSLANVPADLADGDQDNQDLSNVLTQGADAGGQTISNVADPTAAQDVATKNYVDALPDSDNQNLSNVISFGNDAGGSTIANVADPIGAQDVATKNYVDTRPDTDNQDLSNVISFGNDAGGSTIANVADPLSAQDVATKNYVDTRPDNDSQDLSSVISFGNNAGGSTIANVADPLSAQDVATKNYVDTRPDNDSQDLSNVISFGNDAGGSTIANVADPISAQDVATKNYVDAKPDNDSQDLSSVISFGNDAGGNSITNVADPVGLQDVATKNYVDNLPADDNQDLADVLSQGADAAGQQITNLLDPTNPQDAATKFYVDNLPADDNQDLADVLSQGADAAGQQITNLLDPTSPQDAATKFYVDNLPPDDNQDLADVLSQGADAAGQQITNLLDPTNPQDAATKFYVDNLPADDNQDLADVLSQGADAAGQQITNLLDPTSPQDAATKFYVDNLPPDDNQDLADVLSQGADAAGQQITNLLDPTSPQDAATKFYVDNLPPDDNQDLADVLSQGADAAGQQITNLLDPTNPQDAATKFYVDNIPNTDDQEAFEVPYDNTGDVVVTSATTVEAAIKELDGSILANAVPGASPAEDNMILKVDIGGTYNWETQSGADVFYDNVSTGLSSTTVQSAIDEIKFNSDATAVPGIAIGPDDNKVLKSDNAGSYFWALQSGNHVFYDNVSTGLAAADVQGAIDEIKFNSDATAVPGIAMGPDDNKVLKSDNAGGYFWALQSGNHVFYDNVSTGLAAADVQGAIDEIKFNNDATAVPAISMGPDDNKVLKSDNVGGYFWALQSGNHVFYDNVSTGLAAADVQGAIDEIKFNSDATAVPGIAMGPDDNKVLKSDNAGSYFWALQSGNHVFYDNVSTGLAATDVQGAIDEIKFNSDATAVPGIAMITDDNKVLKSDNAGGYFWSLQSGDHVFYDNVSTGLAATDVQGAIDEIKFNSDATAVPVISMGPDDNKVLKSDNAGSYFWALQSGDHVFYDNVSTGLAATDVQGAIDEIKFNNDATAVPSISMGPDDNKVLKSDNAGSYFWSLQSGDHVFYDNVSTGLAATDVQGAIDEIKFNADATAVPAAGPAEENMILKVDGAGIYNWEQQNAFDVNYVGVISGLGTNVEDVLDGFHSNVYSLMGIPANEVNYGVGNFLGLISDNETTLGALQALESAVQGNQLNIGTANTQRTNLTTLSGVPANATDLGIFPGNSIGDNSTILDAFSDLEVITDALTTLTGRPHTSTDMALTSAFFSAANLSILDALEELGDAVDDGSGAEVDDNDNVIAGNSAANTIDQTPATGALRNVLIGNRSAVLTTGDDNVLIGDNADVATPNQFGATAIGKDATAGGNKSLAVGNGATTSGVRSIAIGSSLTIADGAESQGTDAIAIGTDAQANHLNGVAIGRLAETLGDDATALGMGAGAALGGVALGQGSRVNNIQGVGLGSGTVVDADNAVAIGASTYADQPNTVVVGDGTNSNFNVGIGTNDPRTALQIGDNFGLFNFRNTPEAINAQVMAENLYNIGEDLYRREGRLTSGLILDDGGLEFMSFGTGDAESLVDIPGGDASPLFVISSLGDVEVTGSVRLGTFQEGPGNELPGMLQWNTGNVEVWNGTVWETLGGGGGLSLPYNQSQAETQPLFNLTNTDPTQPAAEFNQGAGLAAVVMGGDLEFKDGMDRKISMRGPGPGQNANNLLIGAPGVASTVDVYRGGDLILSGGRGGDGAGGLGGNIFVNPGQGNVPGRLVVNGGLQLNIGSPTAGYVLTTDGAGNASWEPATGGGLTLPVNETENLVVPLFRLQSDNTAQPAAEFNNIDPASNALRLGGNVSFKNDGFNHKVSMQGPTAGNANNLLISGASVGSGAGDGGDVRIDGGDAGTGGGTGGDVHIVAGTGTASGKVFLEGDLRIDDGTAQPNYVLTAVDASGNAQWQEAGGQGVTVLGTGDDNYMIGPDVLTNSGAGNLDAGAVGNLFLGGNRVDVLENGNENILIGQEANVAAVDQNATIAIGVGARTQGNFTVAIGSDAGDTPLGAWAQGDFAIALGSEAQARAFKTVAIGNLAEASSDHGIAIGSGANVQETSGVAIGRQATVDLGATNSVAIGAQTDAINPNTIILGDGQPGSNPNVGVGTNNPQSKLHVDGDLRIGEEMISVPKTTNITVGSIAVTGRFMILTNNGGLQNLNGGQDGMEVILLNQSGGPINVTQDGNLDLQGPPPTDFEMQQNQTLHLIFHAGKWFEIGRSTN